MRTDRLLLPPKPLSSVLSAALILVTVLLVSPPLANAYLMMVRQGDESQEIPNANDLHGSAIATGDFGAALTAGDFNLDTFDDLAVGSPGEDGGSGAVFVIPGNAGGLSRDLNRHLVDMEPNLDRSAASNFVELKSITPGGGI